MAGSARLSDAVGVTQRDTDLRGGDALLRELDDVLLDLRSVRASSRRSHGTVLPSMASTRWCKSWVQELQAPRGCCSAAARQQRVLIRRSDCQSRSSPPGGVRSSNPLAWGRGAADLLGRDLQPRRRRPLVGQRRGADALALAVHTPHGCPSRSGHAPRPSSGRFSPRVAGPVTGGSCLLLPTPAYHLTPAIWCGRTGPHLRRREYQPGFASL